MQASAPLPETPALSPHKKHLKSFATFNALSRSGSQMKGKMERRKTRAVRWSDCMLRAQHRE